MALLKIWLKKHTPASLWNTLRDIYYNAIIRYNRVILSDYSQSGETNTIRELLGKEKGDSGFFIEIGANDGITFSSTFGLVKDGWSGLAIEANPVVFSQLQKNWKKYPNTKTLCLAVAPKRGPVKLFLGINDPQGLLSTICTENSEWFEKHRSDKYVEVPGVPLKELLAEQGATNYPDFLLLDAEGMDYEILSSMDFEKFRPKLIVTEDYQPKDAVKFQLLERAGYTLTKHVGCNTFWLDKIPAKSTVQT